MAQVHIQIQFYVKRSQEVCDFFESVIYGMHLFRHLHLMLCFRTQWHFSIYIQHKYAQDNCIHEKEIETRIEKKYAPTKSMTLTSYITLAVSFCSCTLKRPTTNTAKSQIFDENQGAYDFHFRNVQNEKEQDL